MMGPQRQAVRSDRRQPWRRATFSPCVLPGTRSAPAPGSHALAATLASTSLAHTHTHTHTLKANNQKNLFSAGNGNTDLQSSIQDLETGEHRV